ncbi:hypothetical protein D6827_01640 [Candidatus Parcubacteria bacterium]|nr:MAG: hypothetical protein D6827_01640 [Candidatus Parcubacteria bacterium]
MKYAKHRSNLYQRKRKANKILFVYLVIVVFLIGGVIYFVFNQISGNNAADSNEADYSTNDRESDDLSVSLEISTEEDSKNNIYDQEIIMRADGAVSGTAERKIENEIFYYSVSANLPVIDSEKNKYTVWLVKPGITDYFAVGDMVLLENGSWQIEWEKSLSEKNDLWDYNKTIITLQSVNDDGPSSKHILTGEF